MQLIACKDSLSKLLIMRLVQCYTLITYLLTPAVPEVFVDSEQI